MTSAADAAIRAAMGAVSPATIPPAGFDSTTGASSERISLAVPRGVSRPGRLQGTWPVRRPEGWG